VPHRSNVHDNTIVGYDVDGPARRVVLRTEYNYQGAPFEKIDVVFEGVEAYSFRHDCFGNIVSEILDQPVDEAVRQHWTEFAAGFVQSGWPRFWMGDEEKTRQRIAALVRDGAKWFELISSIGMEGWVFCHTIEYRTISPEATARVSITRGG